jgi:hypothetical protein
MRGLFPGQSDAAGLDRTVRARGDERHTGHGRDFRSILRAATVGISEEVRLAAPRRVPTGPSRAAATASQMIVAANLPALPRSTHR